MERRIRILSFLFLFFCLGISQRGKSVYATGSTVTDLDLGDYQRKMTVGTSQLLTVTVLPVNITDSEVYFSSNDKSVAEVNALGRITANKIGKAEITVESGKVKKVIDLEVKAEEDIASQATTVKAIEVDEFKEEMNVDDTQNVTATVTPTTAVDAAISYSSSNPDVAKVGPTGKITALKKGTTKIILSAGGIKKELKLSVKVPTMKIDISTTYAVLCTGDHIDLAGKVYPQDAVQVLTYKTTNNKVASVTEDGRVTAKTRGSASIIVSNGDTQAIATIIVNESNSMIESGLLKNEDNTLIDGKVELLSMIKSSKDERIYLKIDETNKITSDILKYIYENKKTLIIEGDKYYLTLYGNDITNFENEWNPMIQFNEEKNGISFIINDGKRIPGSVYITLSNDSNLKGKYVYLYNEGKGKYELLSTKIQQGEVKVDLTGKYMITENKMNSFHWNYVVIGIVVLCIIGGGIAYICVARKYWFW